MIRTAELIIAAGVVVAAAVIGCLTAGGTSWPPRRHWRRP